MYKLAETKRQNGDLKKLLGIYIENLLTTKASNGDLLRWCATTLCQ